MPKLINCNFSCGHKTEEGTCGFEGIITLNKYGKTCSQRKPAKFKVARFRVGDTLTNVIMTEFVKNPNFRNRNTSGQYRWEPEFIQSKSYRGISIITKVSRNTRGASYCYKGCVYKEDDIIVREGNGYISEQNIDDNGNAIIREN